MILLLKNCSTAVALVTVVIVNALPAAAQAEEAVPFLAAPPAAAPAGVVKELPPPPSATAPAASAVVAINSPVPYYIDRGTTMVPIRPICDFLEISISSADRVLTFTQKPAAETDAIKRVALRIGGRSAQILHGLTTRTVDLALPAEARLGNTFLPLRFVREAFDVSIGFRARDNALVVTDDGRAGVLTPDGSSSYSGSNAATLTVTNRVGRALSLRLGGPQSVILELGHGQSITRKVRPGVYYYTAGSAGMKPRSGARRLTSGQRATWSWGRR